MNKFHDDTVLSKRGLIRAREHRQPNDSFSYSEFESPNISSFAGNKRRTLNLSNALDSTVGGPLEISNFFSESFRDVDQKNVENMSVKEKTNMLFPQFLEVLQSRTNDCEVFDTIQDLIQTCNGILEEIVKEGRQINEKYKLSEKWLQQERDTWRLLYALYKDRMVIQKEEGDTDMMALCGSEKEIISQLYSSNATLREYQLVVDWLEACAAEETIIEVGHFTDRTVAWENTLWQLRNPEAVAFGGGHDIVKSLDPDASHRENKPLHPLDMEDDARLVKNIFMKIRYGRIEDAQAMCEYCGQPWRAAILEGWRLHEDPNYESGNANEKLPIDGNPRRDLWKWCAWRMADDPEYNSYNRAICGALCGHLDSMLNVIEDSWWDLLWAYLKVQIDIRVESEVRSCCTKSYLQMPEKYWNSKMTLEQIFDEIAVHKNASVRTSAKNKITLIQKHLILDNTKELLEDMNRWIEEEKLTPHMLRFLSHIVLFLRQIGKIHKEDIADRIIKGYVECLVNFGDPQLIAFYSAALPAKLQTNLYTRFLERVEDTNSRRVALEEALSAGLDLDRIISNTVQVMINRQESHKDEKILRTETSDLDELKISSLEFLTFYPQHKGELLWQANALIRAFLAEGKIECVRKAFKMIPPKSIEQIILVYGSKENLPCREECSIKEYLCLQTYLSAIDGFNQWTHLYHNSPKEPQPIKNKTSVNFTEKMVIEHKAQIYRAEVNKWNLNLKEQAKITRDLLFNVLLFPEKGWLVDPETVKQPNEYNLLNEWNLRLVQMENLRKLCIPEIVLLLHKVLHTSGEYTECIKLADELASEQRQLYRVYPKHKLAELLAKLAGSSMELMNQKLDPWGYKINS